MAQKLNIIYLSVTESVPPHSYWDMGMIDYLFEGFEHVKHETRIINPKLKGGVVVIPARNQANDVDKINYHLNKLEWCVVILTGDEESVFPFEELRHRNMRLWVMSPKQLRHDGVSWLIGSGFREEERPILKKLGLQERDQDWFFSGQITHEIRENMANNLRELEGGKLLETGGFGQGLDYEQYITNMAKSKVVPAPSGPKSPDNFRLYEALEAGCIPVGNGGDYWSYLFKEIALPFPIIGDDWASFGYLLPQLLKDYQSNANKTFAWWQLYKRRMFYKLFDDIKTVSGEPPVKKYKDEVTVLISSSPIPDHPSTEMIEKTIKSIRDRLPNSEIFVMIDGVRTDSMEYKLAYEEYIKRLLWKLNFDYENIYPVLMDEFVHQTGMTREALKLVRSPYVLFVEHDTPLVGDTDFEGLKDVIANGYSNIIRLLHEAKVLDEHQHLQLDKKPQEINGVPLIRSMQWSQRPHLASTRYYQKICDKYWDDQPRFIEHVMYGVVLASHWPDHKLHIYAPKDKTWLRSGNLNGKVYKTDG